MRPCSSTSVPLVLTALLILAGALACSGAPPVNPAANTALRGDSRLDQPVSLALEYTPISRVLPILQQRVGVKLAATRDTADDKVTLFLVRRPAREALALLAEHLDFRWYRKGEGYELAQDLAAKRREADLRSRTQAARVAAIRERMAMIQRLAALKPEQLDARQREINRRLADPAAPPDQKERLVSERSAIADLGRPLARAFVEVWQSLTPAQGAQLDSTGEVRLSSTAGTLRDSIAERFVREGSEHFNRTVTPFSGESRDSNERIDNADLRIRLVDEVPRYSGNTRKGERRLQLVFEAATTHGKTTYPTRWFPRMEGTDQDDAPPPAPTSDPELLRPITLTVGQLRESGGAREIKIGPAKFARTQTLVPLSGWLRTLHQVSGLEFIADGFIRARLDVAPVSTPEGRTRPIVELLNALSDALDYEWSKEGKIVRLRSRFFYFDRPEEVPDRILQPWIRRRISTGPLQSNPGADLTDISGLAAALTDAQCRGLDEFWDWYTDEKELKDLGGFVYFYRHSLRLWASLNALQRKALLSGAGVPLRTLSPVQHSALLRVLAAPESTENPVISHWWEPLQRRELTREELATASLTAELEQYKGGARKLPTGGTAYTPSYRVDLRIDVGDRRRSTYVAGLTRW